MSAFGTKRTSDPPWKMSAFGGKAEITGVGVNVWFWRLLQDLGREAAAFGDQRVILGIRS